MDSHVLRVVRRRARALELAKVARDAAIVAAYEEGATLREIADAANLNSRQHVNWLLDHIMQPA